MRILLTLLLALSAIPAVASGGPAPPEFARADGQRAWRFPADHGAHPAYRLEWWYWTGHVRAEDGRAFGFQVTFFRQGVTPRLPAGASAWRVQSLYLAHAALSDVGAQRFRQASRMGRDSLGMSGAARDDLRVWLGPWRADPLPGDPHGARLAVDAGDFALALDLRAEKPPVLHGEGGLDHKGAAPGQASWYYSLPRLSVAGTVTVDGRTFPVTGAAWMDHEFGTNQLGPEQAGWDWIALRLSDGYDLMLYRLRRRDGMADPASHGTLIDPAGRAHAVALTPAETLAPQRTWQSPASGARYPVAWRIGLPAQALALELAPAFDAQELVPGAGVPFAYWEGAVRARGTHAGRPVTGEGYLELTGYAGGLAEFLR